MYKVELCLVEAKPVLASLPFGAADSVGTVGTPTESCQGESNQQDEEDDEHDHDGFPFWTHRQEVGAAFPADLCRSALFSFTHVNDFLLLSLPGKTSECIV